MTAADLQQGKLNWLAPWIGLIIIIGGWVYYAGSQTRALETVQEDVRALKDTAPKIIAMEAKSDARDREFDGIVKRLDGIDEKLDRLIEGRFGPRR